jgi:hypothetical protein
MIKIVLGVSGPSGLLWGLGNTFPHQERKIEMKIAISIVWLLVVLTFLSMAVAHFAGPAIKPTHAPAVYHDANCTGDCCVGNGDY